MTKSGTFIIAVITLRERGVKMIRIKNNTDTWNTDTWKYIKSHFPTIHLFKNVYLLRQFTYARRMIARWEIVIVESEETE
jgi:hypothetical protein